jgi:hypothetical protein
VLNASAVCGVAEDARHLLHDPLGPRALDPVLLLDGAAVEELRFLGHTRFSGTRRLAADRRRPYCAVEQRDLIAELERSRLVRLQKRDALTAGAPPQSLVEWRVD